MKAESNFEIQMFAKEPGHVIVSLAVTPHPQSRLQIKDGAKLKDEVQIQVCNLIHNLIFAIHSIQFSAVLAPIRYFSMFQFIAIPNAFFLGT